MKFDETGSFTIGTLAAAADVHVETIRYYQRRGLLRAPGRIAGQVRRYGWDDVERVRFIKAAQRLGFTLAEVAALLELEDGTHCGEARRTAERKLELVRAKLRGLRRMERALKSLVSECIRRRGSVRCPLITALKVGN